MMPKTGSTVCWRSRYSARPSSVELGGHDFEPFGLGFLHRHLGLGRAEVVAPPTARRPGRHQSLNVALGKRRDLVAVGIAVVRQHRRGPAENGRDRRDVRHQLIAVAGAVGDPGAHDQLRAPGIHHGLSVIGLAVLVLLALARSRLSGSLRLLCSSARGVSSGGFGCLPLARPVRVSRAATLAS